MYATYVIWSKHMTKFFRSAEQVIGLAVQSVLWVLLFGVGMSGFIGTVEGFDYMSFMLPGIIALGALGGAVGGGLILLEERLHGVTRGYLVAPIPRLSILLATAWSTVTKSLFQALLMLIVGLLMGAHLVVQPLGWLVAVVLMICFALGFSGMALAMAAQSRSIMGYHGMIFLFNLPLLFASNALYPLAALPGWMQTVVLFNPTTYFIDTVRMLVFGIPPTLPMALSVGVLLLFALAGIGLAFLSFRQSLRA
ncbi:MAG: ABC transporter permease [Chloroflexaceae bacterium]|nr:ABC transporter permease [Chloroflexaceae bacterium]